MKKILWLVLALALAIPQILFAQGGSQYTQDCFLIANVGDTYICRYAANALTGSAVGEANASSGNYNSNFFGYTGTFWNGSAKVFDRWFWQDVVGTGTTPTSTLTLGHSGSSGTASVSFGTLPLTGLFTGTFTSSSANPASAGILRLATGDGVYWRNAANSGDLSILDLGAAAGNLPADEMFVGGGGLGSAAFISPTSNPAVAGILRLASADAIKWRNGANGADVGLSHSGSAGSGLGADFLDASGFGGVKASFVKSNQTVQVTGANYTTSATTLAGAGVITGLSFTLPASVAANYSFHCDLVYSQATAAAANLFGITTSGTAPTSLLGFGEVYTSLAGANVDGSAVITTATSTTLATATPGAFGAIGTTADMFAAHIWGTIEAPSNASPSVVGIAAASGNASDALTIYRGSACYWY